MNIKDTEIELFGRSLLDATTDIYKLFPDPDKLLGETLTLSEEEEYCLDQMMGMFWPGHLMGGLKKLYKADGLDSNIESGSIGFGDNGEVTVTFISKTDAIA